MTNIRNIDGPELSHRHYEKGREWAVADQQWWWVQEYRKVLLAELTLEYSRTEGVTKAKELARSDKRFRDHLEAMKVALENRNLAKVEYEECQYEIKRRLNKAFIRNREHAAGSLQT
ncbi:MAG: hypothetical protein OEZ19_10115 [Paracoccaceae bacterium]|nr:hypothetical protein [Paracoccaceae bacterium]